MIALGHVISAESLLEQNGQISISTAVVQYPIPLEEFAVGDLWHLDDFWMRVKKQTKTIHRHC